MRTDREEPRWWGLLERVEVPAGLLLLGGGFLAVGAGWLEASGTPDVRIQMQDLISGGIGGLTMVVAGLALLIGAVITRAGGRLEQALLALAAPVHGGDDADPAEATELVGTHASYHRAGCDLVADRPELLPLQRDEVDALSPCSVCHPEVLT